ncbi:type II toxin-antitoxin system VapC family toxin [Endozoicomonas sp. SCSIO W0465]|uniref:type II toxin-antitoxin system VapC family toxin n=1 Tax=Endozoicomonas sp. SCSIO W0465 TaxID=2918516 RepID=UPI00207665E7|nr:type II toxin-antitoxin system VapC family toxin [Endozoicomonas sp. SCSIO W0465]USE34121.1 type II toxin-antitoxin system VapC family toxin [Endozoicomonas sp. SCSIO W0465]
MIVADTNILVYLYLPTQFTPYAEKLLEMEPVWVAPYLWRSEFRNVLALYLRKGLITYEKALQIQQEAELLMSGNEYDIKSLGVLSLVNQSNCSAYDCEYVSLAMSLCTKLFTMDKKVISEFPRVARSLQGLEL